MPSLRELRHRLVLRTSRPKTSRTVLKPIPSARMLEILAVREALHAKIEDVARNGVVPDALPLSLFANHFEQLAEWRRLYAEEQLGIEACLHRLDAVFPEPPPPAPEPPAPPPPQYFPRLGRLLSERPGTRPH